MQQSGLFIRGATEFLNSTGEISLRTWSKYPWTCSKVLWDLK